MKRSWGGGCHGDGVGCVPVMGRCVRGMTSGSDDPANRVPQKKAGVGDGARAFPGRPNATFSCWGVTVPPQGRRLPHHVLSVTIPPLFCSEKHGESNVLRRWLCNLPRLINVQNGVYGLPMTDPSCLGFDHDAVCPVTTTGDLPTVIMRWTRGT